MLDLTYLIALSMAALLMGAGLGYGLRQAGSGLAALKGMTASFIGGLLALHVLPETYERIGAWSLALIVAGFLCTMLPERLFPGHGKEGGRFFTAEMAWIGLVFHQVADGAGLALASDGGVGDWHLALVVLAHRIPVAAVVFWIFQRRGSVGQAWFRVLIMGVATGLGALFAQNLFPLLSGNAVNMVYAFVSGAFLHLLAHDFVEHHAHSYADRRFEFGGFILGALFFVATAVWGPGHAHEMEAAAAAGADMGEYGFFGNFLTLIKETAPYLLLGLIISGLLHAYLPASPIAWLKRGSHLRQSVKGMAFGLPLPVCSCGVLPLFMSLARRGVPPACLLSFLVATPELGVDSFLLSVKLLGWQFTTVRLLVAIALPIVIALIAVRFLPERPVIAEESKSCCHPGGPAATTSRVRAWSRFAFVDLVDDIFPMVFLGLAVAALAQTLWPVSEFGQLVGQWDVLLLGLLGIPFYVCASASAPFALVLLQHGFSVGAVVVFLFAGPATNVATILTVNKAFGKGSGLKVAGVALLAAASMGLLVNAFYQPTSLDILELHEHGWRWFDYLSVGGLALLALASLYRLGPLHWFSTVADLAPGLVKHPHVHNGADETEQTEEARQSTEKEEAETASV